MDYDDNDDDYDDELRVFADGNQSSMLMMEVEEEANWYIQSFPSSLSIFFAFQKQQRYWISLLAY